MSSAVTETVPAIVGLAHVEGLVKLVVENGVIRFERQGQESFEPCAISAIVKTIAGMDHAWADSMSQGRYMTLVREACERPFDDFDPRLFFKSADYAPLTPGEREAVLDASIRLALRNLDLDELLDEVTNDGKMTIGSSAIDQADIDLATVLLKEHFHDHLEHMLQVAGDTIGDCLAQAA